MKRSGSEKAKLKKSPSTKKLKDSSKREADSDANDFEIEISSKKQNSAALTIQRIWRSYRVKKTFKNLWFAHTWNQLDIKEEQETTKDEEELEMYLKKLQERKALYAERAKQLSAKLDKEPDTSSKKKAVKKIKQQENKYLVDDSYHGPHISKTIFASQESLEYSESQYLNAGITFEFVVDMIAFFKTGGVLHYKYAHQIITEAIAIFEELSTVVQIAIPEGGRLTVVGDIHGQLSDLLTIFTQNGLPSMNNVYVFNGDFVDRGKNGVECLLILYAFKVLYPQAMFLNRGNHEQITLNERYGFADEVRDKYDAEMFDLITDSYRYLPLVSVIDNRIAVLHGGLVSKENITISDLNDIDRTIDIPPPSKRKGDAKLIEEILWSDPRDDIDGFETSDRGSGILFGKDLTDTFLSNNGLELLIRSHEKEDEGYRFRHDNKCVTVFSSSYYCGTNENKGAYISFSGKEKPIFHSYYASNLLKEQDSHYFEKQCFSQTLAKLREKIFYSRHELMYCFTQLDTDKDGKITRLEWSNALTSVLNLSLPWMKLQGYLAKMDSEGKIEYAKFLDRFKLKMKSDLGTKWRDAIVEDICSKIYENSQDLVQEFKRISLRKSGLNYVDFVEAIKKYDVGLTDENLFDLMRSIDVDGNGKIDEQEFLNSFQIAFDRVKTAKDAATEWLRNAVNQIGEIFHSKKLKVKQAFELFDTEKEGRLSVDKFSEILSSLGLNYSEEECLKIANYVDSNQSGYINYYEFKDAFRVVYTKSTDKWQLEVLTKLCEMFHKNRLHLKAAFAFFDKDGSGLVDLDEFKAGLEGLDMLKDRELSSDQIKQLYDTIDKDQNGVIDYEEFLHSFEIVDTTEEDQDEEDVKKDKKKATPKKKTTTKKGKKVTPKKKAASSDSEDDKKKKTTTKKSTPKKKTTPKKKEASDSEDDDDSKKKKTTPKKKAAASDDEEDTPKKKPTPKKKKTDDDEEEESVKKPAKKKHESDDEEEDEKPKAKKQKEEIATGNYSSDEEEEGVTRRMTRSRSKLLNKS